MDTEQPCSLQRVLPRMPHEDAGVSPLSRLRVCARALRDLILDELSSRAAVPIPNTDVASEAWAE